MSFATFFTEDANPEQLLQASFEGNLEKVKELKIYLL